MTKKDGRVVAHGNELQILRALHRFGWLRTRDLAALVWQRWAANSRSDGPSFKPPVASASGLRMAQRTLRRLREKRHVLDAIAPDGSAIYALAEAGARALQQMGILAATGKDLVRRFSTSHFRHRCICNEIAISSIVDGFRVSTEREIAKGLWLGGEMGLAGKKPDVLIRSASMAWWLEVERSRKNARDYGRLLEWLDKARQAIPRLGHTDFLNAKCRLAKIIFVCSRTFEARLCRDLEARGWTIFEIDSVISFKKSLYKLEEIQFFTRGHEAVPAGAASKLPIRRDQILVAPPT